MWNAGALGHGDKEHQPTPVVVDYFYDNVRLELDFESRESQSKTFLRDVTSCWHFQIREICILGDVANMYVIHEYMNRRVHWQRIIQKTNSFPRNQISPICMEKSWR